MNQKRIANQHHACFQSARRSSCEVRAASRHPLSDHIEDVLYMVQINMSI